MEYTYKLPKKLNLHNCNLTLYGGYTVNLESKNKKLSVIADDIFSQELFRGRLNMYGGNNNEQNEYLDIYLYEQALIRTKKILKNMGENDEDINIQIENYNLLRKMLKQNENIMESLYNIRNIIKGLMNIEKLNIDFSDRLFNYNLINDNDSLCHLTINIDVLQKILKNNISDKENEMNEYVYEKIKEWKNDSNKKYMVISLILGRCHANYLFLYKSEGMYWGFRIEPNKLIQICDILVNELPDLEYLKLTVNNFKFFFNTLKLQEFNEKYIKLNDDYGSYIFSKNNNIQVENEKEILDNISKLYYDIINKLNQINKNKFIDKFSPELKNYIENFNKIEDYKNFIIDYGIIYNLLNNYQNLRPIILNKFVNEGNKRFYNRYVNREDYIYKPELLNAVLNVKILEEYITIILSDHKNILIDKILKKILMDIDINYDIVVPNNGVQTSYDISSNQSILSNYYYEYSGFCTVFPYYIVKEFLLYLDKNKKNLNEGNIKDIMDIIHDDIGNKIRLIDINKDVYAKNIYDKHSFLKYDLQKILWIANINKELVKFRNKIIPFGVSNEDLIVFFVKKYYQNKLFRIRNIYGIYL